MPYRDLLEYAAHERVEQKEHGKLDFYLSRMTAQMQAQLNPKGNYSPSDFLFGESGNGDFDMRKASSDQIRSMFLTAFPNAKYEGPKNG